MALSRTKRTTPACRQAGVLPVGELVLWYGMFAPYGRLLGTTGFAVGLHKHEESSMSGNIFYPLALCLHEEKGALE